MKLVAIEGHGSKYYINKENIVAISQHGTHVEITMVGGKSFRIQGDLESVVTLLGHK